MKQYFDVIIVGAGPAGIGCALALEGKGLTVALLDKDSFPRDKVCGDAIPGQAFKALKTIHPKWELQLKACCERGSICTSRFFLSAKKSFAYRWYSYACNSKRFDFDHFLFTIVKEQTSTTIFTGNKVCRLTRRAEGIHCDLENGLELVAPIIVGCDGDPSLVKKSLSVQEKQKSAAYAAIRAYYKGISGGIAGENEFHLVDGIDGYFWIFPLPDDHYNIGFGIINDKTKKTAPAKPVRQKLNEIIESDRFKARFHHAQRIGNLQGHGLPIWTSDQHISGDRFMLAGDAASLVDPIQGHGIDKALWSGIIAANQVQRCFAQNNFTSDFMLTYDKEINQKFGHELKRNYRLLKLVTHYPFIWNLFLYLPISQKLINGLVKRLKL